jgi:hypothetical protein
MDIRRKLSPKHASLILDHIPEGRDNGRVEPHNRQQLIDHARAGLGVFVVARFHSMPLGGAPPTAVLATRAIEAAEAVVQLPEMAGHRVHWRST